MEKNPSNSKKKRLTLSKETLGQLDNATLERVAGGSVNFSILGCPTGFPNCIFSFLGICGNGREQIK